MLKITVSRGTGSVVIKLEGRLVGPWVEEAEKAWKSLNGSSQREQLRVDLCGVMFVDAKGQELLARMHQAGAELAALGPMTNYIVRGIEAGQDSQNQGGTK
jgi:hypothetical protein